MDDGYRVNLRHETIGRILRSAMAAKSGRHHDAHDHARQAYHSAQAYRDHCAAHENHSEIASFNAKVNPMFTHLEHILAEIPKPKKLKKSILNAPGKEPLPVNRNPGRDTRFVYKPFHELKPQEQIQARHSFGHSKDAMESYHYATDANSGSMIHGQRWLAPKEPPQASVGMKGQSPEIPAAPKMPGAQPNILPQHAAGALVVINSPSHPFHGSVGEVQHPNPQMQGQIKIKVSNKSANRFEHTYVQPHEVSLSRKIEKTEDSKVILLKSKAALKRIGAQKKK